MPATAAAADQPAGILYWDCRLGIGIPPCDYAPSAYATQMCNGVFTAESVGGLPLNETTTAEALSAAGCELQAISIYFSMHAPSQPYANRANNNA